MECQEEMESEIVVDSLIDKILEDVVSNEVVKVSKGLVSNVIESALKSASQPTSSSDQSPIKIVSNFTLSSDEHDMWTWNDGSMTTSTSSLDVHDLIADVVKKIMRCFDGGHEEVYAGQTSTTDCRTKDGEEIIRDIITRLVVTVQNFTKSTYSGTPVTESTESILSSGQSSRESLKDLHKRAQFLLNHALDIAQVKLKLSGYSYLTWNIMEDCLKKGKDKLLLENAAIIAQLTDVEIVEWIMEEAKTFLQHATTLMYDMMHGSEEGLEAEKEIVEQRYLEQLEKSDQTGTIADGMLEEAAAEGDVAKFAVLLVKKILNEAAMSIPRKSSDMLTEALRDGNYHIAGSILATTEANKFTVAQEEVEFDPKQPDKIRFKEALRDGDIIKSGTLLASRAIQQAMDLHHNDCHPTEKTISAMILEAALDQGDLDKAGEIIIESSLREAVKYISTPTPDLSLDQALKFGDLEVAGTIITDMALEQGLQQLNEENRQVRRDSSIALEGALHAGNIPVAGDIIVSRLLRSGLSELEKEVDDDLVDQVLNRSSTVIPMSSSVVLHGALKAGNLDAAAPVLIDRALRSAMNGAGDGEDKEETERDTVVPMSSSVVLHDALLTGNLETAAPVLANRAIRSAQSGKAEEQDEEDIIPMSSSEILRGALVTGNLETAAPVLASRAIRSAQSGKAEEQDEEDIIPMSSSEILRGALVTGNLETAAPVLADRAIKSAMSGEGSVSSVNSFEELKIIKTSSCLGDELVPSFYDGIYYLEAPKKTSIDEETYDRGQSFVKSILDDVASDFDSILEDDLRNKYELLKPSLLKSDYGEAAKILVKRFLDSVRSKTISMAEVEKDRTKFACLMAKSVFQNCLEILRGGPGFEMTKICHNVNDHIRETLSDMNITAGVDAIISMVIGKCLKVLTNSAGKDVRGGSSIELFEACMAGDKNLAGGILTQKVLKKAADATQGDVSTFKSTDEILSEKHDQVKDELKKPISNSNSSIRSARSKKKINTEGLPMPKPLIKSQSNATSSSNYEPVRELLISEEREFMVNQMVSNSERSIEKSQSFKSPASSKSGRDVSRKISIANSIERLAEFCDQQLKEIPRDEGDHFSLRSSDESLPIIADSVSNDSLGYVRKIQSRGHIYYINEDGVIKKRARRKRSSKKRKSQDDLKVNVYPERNSEVKDQDDFSLEPQAVSSESSLLKPCLSNDLPSVSSKKSSEHRRSCIKKKDSSLQVLAVINSSYTNMLGKKTSSEVVGHKESDLKPSSSDIRPKPSIDEMLSETDKELIQKLTSASAEEKQADS